MKHSHWHGSPRVPAYTAATDASSLQTHPPQRRDCERATSTNEELGPRIAGRSRSRCAIWRSLGTRRYGGTSELGERIKTIIYMSMIKHMFLYGTLVYTFRGDLQGLKENLFFYHWQSINVDTVSQARDFSALWNIGRITIIHVCHLIIRCTKIYS